MPIFHEGYQSTSSRQDMMTYLQNTAPNSKDEFMFINCADGNTTQRHIMSTSHSFNQFLTEYAADRNASVKSLRIEHNGRTVFLSTIGKKAPGALGLKDDDIIKLSFIQCLPAEITPREQTSKSKRRNPKTQEEEE